MIKLLLDANLSYRLIKKIQDKFPICLHVSKTGLPIPAKDIEIWKWAKTNGYVIVSNDFDFERLVQVYGSPPKVILFKMGNQRTDDVANLLINNYLEILGFCGSNEHSILEIFKA